MIKVGYCNCSFFLKGNSSLCRIDGMWYCALKSEGYKVTAELLKNVPFTGADLTVIQEQQVSSALCKVLIARIIKTGLMAVGSIIMDN